MKRQEIKISNVANFRYNSNIMLFTKFLPLAALLSTSFSVYAQETALALVSSPGAGDVWVVGETVNVTWYGLSSKTVEAAY